MTQSVNDTLLQEEGAIECTVAAGRSVISLHEPITMSARDQASSVLATVLIAARPVTLDVTGAAEKNPITRSFIAATVHACKEAGIPITVVGAPAHIRSTQAA